MCDLEDGDGGERERQHLSLIRCLSEAVISEEDAAVSGDAATILRSLSETCLARDDDVADGRGVHPMLRDPYLQPALIATNVDDDDDDEDDEVEATAVATSSSAAAAAKDFRCNCGCGVALKTSPVDDPDDYEDEGCYLDRRRRRRRSSHSDNSERQKETGAEEGEMGLDSSSDPPSTASSAATTLNAASKNGEKSSSYSSSSASTSSTASGCKDAGGGGSGSGGTGRRSFSSSVDSGRSSDTGTLGGSESDCSVKIVSHSFCDVLGSEVSGEGEQKSEDGDGDDKEAPAVAAAAGRERMPEMPTIMSMGGGGNKVAVFVPFSAISEYKNDAARAAERRRQRLKESGGGHHSVTDVFMDNVVICDTQVILRINCTASNDQQEEEEEEEEKNDEGKREEEDTLSNGTSGLGQVAEESKRPEAEFSRRKPLPVSAERMTKLKKSRMSRRMTTTVAVYEMVNAARKCKQDALEEAEDESGEGGESEADLVGSSPLRTIPEGESSHGSRPSSVPRSPSKAPPPRRKDLCKLLGLIECDVTTDATSPEDIKVAQKVAIDNLLTAIKENQRKSEESAEASIENAETSVKVGEAGTLQRPQVAKKDLAKFLGIDDEKVDGPPAPATNLNQKSNPPFPPQPQPQRQKKKSLVNWSQMMKQSMSMRWRPADESPARSPEKKPNATPLPHGLDFELPVQLKRVNEVLDCPPEVSLTPDATTTRSTAKAAHGHRRKNLSKFLGMDDSDSEEMVFIQNRRSGPGKGGEAIGSGGGGADDGGGGGGNSLNRSDQGSSIVGIRIVNADDLTFSSKSVEECADRISSSYSSSPSSTISSRDSKQRPSAINGFLRRSANITSQAKPSLRSSSLPHCEERYSSLASSSSNRLAQSREDEIAVVGDDAAGYVDSCGGVETEFSPPPRKNVVFKEYTNFCVEESIALGLPIIPSNGNASSGSTAGNNNQDGTRGRKKKKDAERRSAELVAGHPGTASKQPNHQYFFSSTAASLARGKGGAQGKKANKKNSLEAYLQSSNHDWLLDPPQQEGASLSTPNGTSSIHKGEKPKVARNTVVRGSEPVYLDMFRHQQMVAAVAGHQYHHYHHHNHHRHHSHHNGQQHHAAAAAFHHHRHHPHPHLPNGALPRYLSCSPKGRVRAVKQRPYQHRQQEQQPHQHHHHQQRRQQQRPEYLDELNKVLQA